MGTDAFGNEITAAGAGPPPGSPGRAPGIPVGVLGLILVVLSVAGTAGLLVDREHTNRDDPVQAAIRGEVGMLDPRSMLRSENLARAATALRGALAPDEVVLDVTVSPAGLGVSVRDPAERRRTLTVDLAGTVRAEDGGESDRRGIRAADVPFAAVEPAVRGVLARARAGAQVVGVRATVSADTGEPPRPGEWTLSVEDVRIAERTWFASPDGTRVRRSSEPSAITQGPTP